MMTNEWSLRQLKAAISNIEQVKADTINVQFLELLTIATNKLELAIRNLTTKDMVAVKKVELSDAWVAACQGSEQPFVARDGTRLLYCYQASSGKHAYLDMDRDMILTDEEAANKLG